MMLSNLMAGGQQAIARTTGIRAIRAQSYWECSGFACAHKHRHVVRIKYACRTKDVPRLYPCAKSNFIREMHGSVD